MRHKDITIGGVVRYKPGAGTYGYEDLLGEDGRIKATVRGFGPPQKGRRADRGPKVLISFYRGTTEIRRGVDAVNLA